MVKKKVKQLPKKQNPTIVYAGIALLIIILVAAFLTLNSEKPDEKIPSAGEFVKLDKPTTYEPGKVKIMVFLHFNCIHCNNLEKNLPQLLEKYGDKVSITYVPIVWPRQSTKSIEAYIIAEQMGKGDEMIKALFQAQFDKKIDIIESVLSIEDVAAGIGLGTDFNAKLEGGEARDAALENLKLLREYNVDAVGTPMVVMNGNLYVIHEPVSNLDTVISSLLS